MTVGQGPGIARGPPAARLGSRRPSLGRHSAHPGLSSTLFCRLLRLSSNASMRTNVFFCLWDSFISQEFLYSLPVSKGYLDPLGCVCSSDTPAAQSTHGKWVLAHACQNSTAEPWRHKQGWPWQRWPHGDPPSEFPWSLLTRPCPAVFRVAVHADLGCCYIIFLAAKDGEALSERDQLLSSVQLFATP